MVGLSRTTGCHIYSRAVTSARMPTLLHFFRVYGIFAPTSAFTAVPMLKRACAVVLLFTAVGGGGGNVPTPSPPPTPTAFTLSGQVTDGTTEAPVSGNSVDLLMDRL